MTTTHLTALIDKLMLYICYAIVLFAIISAGGCAQTPIIKTVTQIEYKTVTIPPVLLLPCSVAAPPSQEDYLKANFSEREEYLTNYTVELLGNLKVCNSQISNIKAIQDEQVKAYQPTKESTK